MLAHGRIPWLKRVGSVCATVVAHHKGIMNKAHALHAASTRQAKLSQTKNTIFCISCFRYAPRKPKYFNRIHTGYEWNKYNQTHYDTENPPPKVVQGYKFNIFYPDLLDKSIAPTYR